MIHCCLWLELLYFSLSQLAFPSPFSSHTACEILMVYSSEMSYTLTKVVSCSYECYQQLHKKKPITCGGSSILLQINMWVTPGFIGQLGAKQN